MSGAWIGSLDGQPMVNRLVLAWVAGQRWGMDRRVLGLAVIGRRTGRVIRFPVQYAVHGDAGVVAPGQPEHKVWWRNLTKRPCAVEVLGESGWHSALARVLEPGDPGYEGALAAYRRRWPRFASSARQPLVLFRPTTSHAAETRRPSPPAPSREHQPSSS